MLTECQPQWQFDRVAKRLGDRADAKSECYWHRRDQDLAEQLRPWAESPPIVEHRQRHDAHRAEHQPEDAQIVGRIPVRTELRIDQQPAAQDVPNQQGSPQSAKHGVAAGARHDLCCTSPGAECRGSPGCGRRPATSAAP
jgi:hypothetical protein